MIRGETLVALRRNSAMALAFYERVWGPLGLNPTYLVLSSAFTHEIIYSSSAMQSIIFDASILHT